MTSQILQSNRWRKNLTWIQKLGLKQNLKLKNQTKNLMQKLRTMQP